MLRGLTFSSPFDSNSRWYGRRIACKRLPVGVPPFGVTLLKMASTSAGVVTFLYLTLSRSFKK
jgi:hypothetical protein